MKLIVPFFLLAIFAAGCDDTRLYEKNYDFEKRVWLVDDKPTFDFEISNTAQRYNLYCNVRNSVAFPYARLFVKYQLKDSLGKVLNEQLVPAFLFDQHTGQPQGSSGLGDIYDQRFPILTNYQFDKPGTYKVSFEQYMRKDTLEGILAIGLRVESNEQK